MQKRFNIQFIVAPDVGTSAATINSTWYKCGKWKRQIKILHILYKE